MIENAFIAITPYQIFNILNFVHNDVNGVKGKSDLYVYDHFRDSMEIIERLKSEGIFENVYAYSTVKDLKPRIVSKVRTLLYFINPSIYFKKVFSKADYHALKSKHYINIYQCSDGLFMNAFHRLFQNTSNYLIEDGLYSYYGNMKKDRTGKDYKLVDKYLLNGTLDIHAKVIYVNSPMLCKSTSAKEIKGLPSLANQNALFEIYERVFSFIDSGWYKDKKFIYLTTPYENLRNVTWKNGIANNDTEIITLLKQSGNFAIRLHPRQKYVEEYDSVKDNIDSINNIWELECKNNLGDSCVLISFFSTAVFTPKLLYNKEPYVIFTYRMLTEKVLGDSVVERLKSMYKNPDRIFEPNNIREMKVAIEKICKGEVGI